jgi:hypothetical protein
VSDRGVSMKCEDCYCYGETRTRTAACRINKDMPKTLAEGMRTARIFGIQQICEYSQFYKKIQQAGDVPVVVGL